MKTELHEPPGRGRRGAQDIVQDGGDHQQEEENYAVLADALEKQALFFGQEPGYDPGSIERRDGQEIETPEHKAGVGELLQEGDNHDQTGRDVRTRQSHAAPRVHETHRQSLRRRDFHCQRDQEDSRKGAAGQHQVRGRPGEGRLEEEKGFQGLAQSKKKGAAGAKEQAEGGALRE